MITIRLSNPADNNQLIELAKNLGVPARVTIGIDRGPDFFAFNRMISNEWKVLVAEEDGQIIGFLDMHNINFRINEEIVPGIYFGLAGIRPDKRGKQVFREMMNEVQQIVNSSDQKIAMALINYNNKRVNQILKQWYPQIIAGQKIIIAGLLPFRYYRIEKNYQYNTARDTELPEVIELLNKYRNNYSLGVVIDWHRLFSLPGVSLNNVLVAKSNNRIVSVLGLWDQSLFRQILLMDADKITMGLLSALKIFRPILKISSVPSKGNYLKCIYGFAVATEAGQELAFAGLLRYAITKLSADYHLLMLGLPENDHCLRSVSGLIRITNVNIPLIYTPDDRIKQILSKNNMPQIWFEYAMT